MGRPAKARVALDSLAECEDALHALIEAETEIEILQAECDRARAAAVADFEGRLNAARAERMGLEAALQAYYYGHVKEIEAAGVKHVQLTHGRFGRRDNPAALKPLNRKWSWKAIATAVRAAWPGKYVHPLPEPEIDKDALKALPAEDLRQVGLKVESDETFYIELERVEVKA